MTSGSRNVDGGDALFAVAAEITGEASLLRGKYDVTTSINVRTNAIVGQLSAAIDAGAARICDAKIEAAFRHWMPRIGGPAAMVREVTGDKGDRFERYDDDGTPRQYTVSEIAPNGIRKLTTYTISGMHIFHTTLESLRNPAIFRFVSTEAEREAGLAAVSAAGAAFEMAVVAPDDDRGGVATGERFTCLLGKYAGKCGTVVRFDSDGDAWLELDNGIPVCVCIEELTDEDSWLRGEPAMGPEADVRVGMTLVYAVDLLAEIHQATERLGRAWSAAKDGATFEQVDVEIRKLCELAGVDAPQVHQVAPPIKTETPGLVHVWNTDGSRSTMCGLAAKDHDIGVPMWRNKATCHGCRLACAALPRGGR